MWWKRYCLEHVLQALILVFAAGTALAQEPPDPQTIAKVLARLDDLEKQNQLLLDEIRSLREEVKAQQSPATQANQDLSDRVGVAENRIEEQAQTKVNASQHLPISLTGMILFDSNLIHGTNVYSSDPTYAEYSEGVPGGGATLRQSVIGLELQGPHIAGGGQIHGSISMDFAALSQTRDDFGIRNADVSFDWASRSLTVGQDRPIISPLTPTSFARVDVPALSGAGNLWLWRPQIKYEERHSLSAQTKAVFQAALYATDESYAGNLPAQPYYTATRPSLQGRIGLSHDWSDEAKFSLGVSADESKSHISGQSIPSRVLSTDLLIKPLRWLELTGTLLHGENFANLGGLPTAVAQDGAILVPVKGSAGWMQIGLPVTKRLTFDFYAGRQVNGSRDLALNQIAGTFVYAGNALYRIGPNVVVGFEGAHENLAYASRSLVMANRYDATLAYLF